MTSDKNTLNVELCVELKNCCTPCEYRTERRAVSALISPVSSGPRIASAQLYFFGKSGMVFQTTERTKGEHVEFSPMPTDSTAEDRQRGAQLIAASLIAAIRLRNEPITHSPKVAATISDSITLARMVLQRINGGRQSLWACRLEKFTCKVGGYRCAQPRFGHPDRVAATCC